MDCKTCKLKDGCPVRDLEPAWDEAGVVCDTFNDFMVLAIENTSPLGMFLAYKLMRARLSVVSELVESSYPPVVVKAIDEFVEVQANKEMTDTVNDLLDSGRYVEEVLNEIQS